MPMPLTSTDKASIAGFTLGMGIAIFLEFPILAAIGFGLLGLIIFGLVWTAVLIRAELSEIYRGRQ